MDKIQQNHYFYKTGKVIPRKAHNYRDLAGEVTNDVRQHSHKLYRQPKDDWEDKWDVEGRFQEDLDEIDQGIWCPEVATD